MSRWLKALPLTLALAALSIFTASCSSNDQAQIRFVHAIQDGGSMDIDITGPNIVVPTQVFTDISFLGVDPIQPGYTSVPSGVDKIEGFLTGSTNVGFNSTNIALNGSQQYTIVATGLVASGQNAVILPIPDDIAAPAAGDAAFRVIHASPSGASPVDIYIQLNPSSGPSGSPAISGVGYERASSYVELPTNPNNDITAPGFTVYVTPSGSTVPIFSEGVNPQAGAVRTLILTDVQGGRTMQLFFLELSDLN